MDTENHNGHTHDMPSQKIIVTFDAAHGAFNYTLEGCDEMRALALIELVRHYVLQSMTKNQSEKPT